jgi:hypothetical protein
MFSGRENKEMKMQEAFVPAQVYVDGGIFDEI